MLISALCEYYDELAKEGKAVPEGYSEQDVHYLIALKPDGTIDDIIDYRIKTTHKDKKGKVKEQFAPRSITLPQRTEKTSIDSNIIEHRPLYIFGLNFEKNVFTPDDKTNKARKSHEAFVKANLEFIDGMDSPLINAYRNFILNWIPENEMDNHALIALGKEYKNAYFAFCLSGYPEHLIQDEPKIKDKITVLKADNVSDDGQKSQCAVMGEELPIARIHSKINGIAGGLSSGTVLIGYKASAGCSYGNEQSYNSNISVEAMKKYTTALNSLLSEKKHKTIIDDTTVVYWATGGSVNNDCCDLFNSFFNDTTNSEEDKMDISQTDQMLSDTFNLAREGRITRERISDLTGIGENIDFYIVGFKPNSSRLALKFIYRRRFADILFSIAKHQEDMYITGIKKSVPFWILKKELVSPKANNLSIDASLLSAVFKSILYGSPYPNYLLSTLVSRVKTDQYINAVRAGAIKAYINRQARAVNKKEELTVALDINNTNQAYLCGRLFAVLEKIQRISLNGNEINRTIKDAYFASAASKPSLVFPKLLSLSQNHIKKLNDGNKVFYSKMVQEIISKIDGEFPDTLMLTDQGKFMIGYYHQVQAFFEKNNKEEN